MAVAGSRGRLVASVVAVVCGVVFLALLVSVLVRGLPLGEQLASVISACATLVGLVVSVITLQRMNGPGGGAGADGENSTAFSGQAFGSAIGPGATNRRAGPTSTNPAPPAAPAGPAHATGGGTAATGQVQDTAIGKDATTE